MKKGLAMAIRVLTIAPMMALVLLLTLYFARSDVFGTTLNFVSPSCSCCFSVLAYIAAAGLPV